MIEPARLEVFRNVAPDQPHLAIAHASVRLIQRNLAGAHALYLAANQHNAAFERFEYGIVVLRFAVLGNHPLIRVALLVRSFFVVLSRNSTPH